MTLKTLIAVTALVAAPLTAFAADDNAAAAAAFAELAARQAEDARIAQNLDTFDTLDFDVFTNQKWDRLHEGHAEDIVLHLPDGSTTTGIEPHIQYLNSFFSFAPDTRIEEHPIRIGQGEWTEEGVMDEEYLVRDSATFHAQIGLGQ